jgi:hypothetical protein
MNYATLDLEAELTKLREHMRWIKLFRQTASPEEKADCSTLLSLYEWRETALAAEIDLADMRDRIVPDGELSEMIARDTTGVLQSALGPILLWRKELPQWQKAHDAVAERIKVRDAATTERIEASDSKTAAVISARKLWSKSQCDFVDWVLAEKTCGLLDDGARGLVMTAATEFDIVDKKTGQRKPLSGRNAWQGRMNKLAEGK